MAFVTCSVEGQCERLELWPRGVAQTRWDLSLPSFGKLHSKHVCGCELEMAKGTKAYCATTSSLGADFSRSAMDLSLEPKPTVHHEMNKAGEDTL